MAGTAASYGITRDGAARGWAKRGAGAGRGRGDLLLGADDHLKHLDDVGVLQLQQHRQLPQRRQGKPLLGPLQLHLRRRPRRQRVKSACTSPVIPVVSACTSTGMHMGNISRHVWSHCCYPGTRVATLLLSWHPEA